MKLKRFLPAARSASSPGKPRAGGAQALLCGALLTLSVPALSAATLYEDGFDYAESATLMGLQPTSRASEFGGNGYVRVSGAGTPTVQPAGSVQMVGTVGMGLSFGADVDYTPDRYIALNLDFRQGDLLSGVSEETARTFGNYRYVGVSLGFWQETGGTDGTTFTGVAVDRYGNIKISSGGTILSEVNAGAPLDGSTLYTLSYVVDTQSGSISSLTLTDGQEKLYEGAFASVTAFMGANLNYVGFQSRGNTGSQTSIVENFSVTSIPESSSAAGLFGAAALLVCLAKRNPRRAG